MLFEPVVALCEQLRARGHVITIETAGTVFREVPCDLMSISPKLSNSTPADPDWGPRHEAIRTDRQPLVQLVERYRENVQLKFVVNPDEALEDQLAEIEVIRLLMPGLSSESIVLMAEGIDEETLRRRERLLVPICIERGFRLTPRYHVSLFGNTRGT